MKNDYVKRINEARVYDVAKKSPLEFQTHLSSRFHNQIFLKREDLQPVFSFKLRGAYNKMAGLSKPQLDKGVITASAGNHAQGVALSAKLLGIQATIFMPEHAPLPKVRATEGYGADVRLAGQNVGECLALARQFSSATGAIFVHPFDDRQVIVGQGTLALDIFKQCPDVGTVVVCTGGGGMLSGIAMAMKQLKVPSCGAY